MKNIVRALLLILIFIPLKQLHSFPQVNSNQDPIINSNDDEQKFSSHKITVSLGENKILLENYISGGLTYEDYCKKLNSLGRKVNFSLLIENQLCNSLSDTIYKDLLRSIYFVKNDSLLSIVENRLDKITKIDTSNIIPNIILFGIGVKQNDSELFNKNWAILDTIENAADLSPLFTEIGIFDHRIKEIDKYILENDLELIDYWYDLFELYILNANYSKGEDLILNVAAEYPDSNIVKNNWYLIADLYWCSGDYDTGLSILENIKNSYHNPDKNSDLYLSDSLRSAWIDEEILALNLAKEDYRNSRLIIDKIFTKILNEDLTNWTRQFAKVALDWDERLLIELNNLLEKYNKNLLHENAKYNLGILLIAHEFHSYDEKDSVKVQNSIKILNSLKQNNFLVGYIYYSLKEYERAKIYFNQTDTNSKYYPYSLIYLGHINRLQKHEYIDSYLAAQQILYNNEGLLNLLGYHYYHNKNLDEAYKWFDLGIIIEPKSFIYPLYFLGMAYENNNDLDDAIYLFQRIKGLLENINQDYPSMETVDKRIKEIDEKINMELETLSESGDGILSEIVQLFLISRKYTEINNTFIDGQNNTTPEEKYLELLKETIITSYNMSPKVFLSEDMCDRLLIRVQKLSLSDSKLSDIAELWENALKSRSEGMKLYNTGYIVKKINSKGEFSRGTAKITFANQYFTDGLIILKEQMKKHHEIFRQTTIQSIQFSIDYYTD